MKDYSDWCYECRGLGDDYCFDEDGELQNACPTCWISQEQARLDKEVDA